MQLANLSQVIEKLPEGYNTIVGERGIKLSGGQRQRLSIARAILRDPEILLLDEATAHLDSDSEKLIQEILEKLMKKRTTIVIAHNLATVQNASKIIVFENGVISGIGKHNELLENNSLYKKYVEQQIVK